MGLYRLCSLKDRVLFPLARLAYRLELKPNIITMFGVFLGTVSGWLLVYRAVLFALFRARAQKRRVISNNASTFTQ